jgi:hypothetical protein
VARRFSFLKEELPKHGVKFASPPRQKLSSIGAAIDMELCAQPGCW